MNDNPEPDFSVCGTPLVELLGHHHLDEHVEQAATLALTNPKVGIAVCLFPGEEMLAEFNTWLRHQRELLAAWRATQPDRGGTLKLRTRRIVKPEQNITTAAYVSFFPARVREEVST